MYTRVDLKLYTRVQQKQHPRQVNDTCVLFNLWVISTIVALSMLLLDSSLSFIFCSTLSEFVFHL